MRLPNSEAAVVEPEKVRDYLLSPTHQVGRFKATFFAALGYTQENWPDLERDLRLLASEQEGAQGKFSRFGNKYEVSGILTGPIGRSAHVLTVDRATRREFPQVRDCHARRQAMKFKELDTVVLERDLPEYELRAGDLGAVVAVYEPDGLDVEFVRASGQTQALVELSTRDVRAIRDEDLVAVRTLERTA